jgi:hypothetical protein
MQPSVEPSFFQIIKVKLRRSGACGRLGVGEVRARRARTLLAAFLEGKWRRRLSE